VKIPTDLPVYVAVERGVSNGDLKVSSPLGILFAEVCADLCGKERLTRAARAAVIASAWFPGTASARLKRSGGHLAKLQSEGRSGLALRLRGSCPLAELPITLARAKAKNDLWLAVGFGRW
jgi:hypothetical protein